MKENLEILMSTMNIKKTEDFQKHIEKCNINTNILVVNQVDKGKLVKEDNGRQRIYSYIEKGASKSKNRLIENAQGDICAFSDDDIKYVDDYENIIKKAYNKKPEADVIIFFVKNLNKKREDNKKIGNKKVNNLDIMKARTYEITFKREKIKKTNIKFDNNFGPSGIFKKGEETIFLSDLLKKGINIYSVDKKIGEVENKNSTWFKGYNREYLLDQGAIFYRIYPRFYKMLILQYVIRKYYLYKNNLTIKEAYKEMMIGAKKCEEIYGGKNETKVN